jgi:hypothetical protein
VRERIREIKIEIEIGGGGERERERESKNSGLQRIQLKPDSHTSCISN